MLARDGHDVTVLERDAQPPPSSIDQAWERWDRPGVAQFRQAHFLLARGRHLLDEELPDVRDGLLAAGAARFNPTTALPPSISDRAPRPGDDRFATITARRPTLELVLGRAAEDEPRVQVRRGVAMTGLVTGPPALPGVPHVTGVRTDGGRLAADLVVDAMGRRSRLTRLLAAVDARPVREEVEVDAFTYYTRFFRSRDGSLPVPRTPLLTASGSFSILTLPADREVWSVTLFTSARDRPLTRLRDPGPWTSVVAACPDQAHWLDGEPITGVLPMGGLVDQYRSLHVDGRPVATGVALLADAWAFTNPSVGRGITLALRHAALLRDVLRSDISEPEVLAQAWDAATEADLAPWYRSTVQGTKARLAQIDALREGRQPPAPADDAAALTQALFAATLHDPDIYRACEEIGTCLALPQDVVQRPELVDRILSVTEGREAEPPPGPNRDELLGLLQ